MQRYKELSTHISVLRKRINKMLSFELSMEEAGRYRDTGLNLGK